MQHKRVVVAERQWASAAELSQDLVEADACPHRHRLRGAPLAGATRWDHGTRADEAFEVGGVRVERSELCDRSSTDGDHRALSGFGDPHGFGESRPQFSDSDRSAR